MFYSSFIGTMNGFAVHCLRGTKYHTYLGKPASHGCLRLRCEHAKEFYEAAKRSQAKVFFAGYDCKNSTIQPQENRNGIARFLQKLNRRQTINQKAHEQHCRTLY